jgi:uncharacterized protein (TIGR03437 family)
MKCIPIFFLCAASVFAADFVTGQAARLVVGQLSFTASDPNSSNTVIGGASGVAYAANTLFVADDNRIGATPDNNRVLIFSNVSGTFPAPTDELQYNTVCPICVGAANVVLGQPDFVTTTENLNATSANLRLPTAVASDGVHLVVADTNHNRLLIWNKIPTVNDTPADVVVGQTNFVNDSVPTNGIPSASSMNGPQGVWIQNGKLYVADTQNNRVLIFNHIPTTNGAAADVVLGQPNFTAPVTLDITQQTAATTAANMLDPVSVTSDGTHLFVADLGYNRILIWNSIPTTNDKPADVEIGQPDMTGNIPNNAFSGVAASSSTDTTDKETAVLCPDSNGTDPYGNPTYPNYCNATLNYPRFALSDGTRLFVADGGNDRVLEYLTIPTQNAALADTILGQIGGEVDQATNAADSLNTPTALAWDGSNLYVADPYNRRITVYTVAPVTLPYQAVVNSANQNVYAAGQVTIGGAINTGDIITITIFGASGNQSAQYTYTVKATDTISSVITSLVNEINAGSGDPNVTAIADTVDDEVGLQSILPGPQGNNIGYTATVSSSAQITASAANSTLTGGGDAASVAPGTIVTINGTNLSANTASADLSQQQLPTSLGGTEVYFDGIAAPLTFVSPTQINAQLPWEFTDTTSVNAYVRSVMPDGSVQVTSPVALTIVPANPGIFSQAGTVNPEIGIVVHGSSYAVGVVSVDGSVNAGDVATITIQNRNYNYTVQASDTLDTIRDALVALLSSDPAVTATAAGVFDRIILDAKQPGPDGNSITYTASTSSGAGVIMTAFGSQLCCANIQGLPVTPDNPALPGETIILYATGAGLPVFTGTVQGFVVTGQQYPALAPITQPQQAMNSIAGGSTADVLQCTLVPGTPGLFGVLLHLNSGLGTNQFTEVTIAQGIYVSNAVSFPVFATPQGPPQ